MLSRGNENYIFSIEAILKQTSSLHEKKNIVYYFQISLFVPEIFKFSNKLLVFT